MERIEHREEKWVFPFVEYSPKVKEGKMPLMVQLHGIGERGEGKEDLTKVEIHGLAHYLKENEHECIFVMPQCPLNNFWATRVESIIKFIEQIIKEFDIDEDRVYLTGLSMGGYGTWFTAMARPDLFAAIAPICGGGMAYNADVLKMPVWAFHGADDNIVSPIHSDEMVEKLRGCNSDVKYTRYNGVGHNSWCLAYNRELIDWLLSKKRK